MPPVLTGDERHEQQRRDTDGDQRGERTRQHAHPDLLTSGTSLLLKRCGGAVQIHIDRVILCA